MIIFHEVDNMLGRIWEDGKNKVLNHFKTLYILWFKIAI